MLTIYMDNCGNSRANTCTKALTLTEKAHLLDQDQWVGRATGQSSYVVTLDNFR